MCQVCGCVCPVVRMEKGVGRCDRGVAFVFAFGVALVGELMGVHLQKDKGGVGVVVGLVPVWGEWLTGENECKVFQVSGGCGGCEEVALDGRLDSKGDGGADAGDDIAY